MSFSRFSPKKTVHSVIDKSPIAIHSAKDSGKVLVFAASGHGMSQRWWDDTFKARHNGALQGVYKVKSGKLRRTVI